MINDFLDNLGAQQHEKMIEKNASKEEYYNSQSEGKEFDKNSQEKNLTPEEMHPFKAFPYRLEYRDGNEDRICHFDCEEHRQRYIKRYQLRKGSYFIDTLT